jgi:Tfp pilus assembly protein PilN
MTAPNELSFLPEDYLEQKYARRANAVCIILALLAGGAMLVGWHWLRDRNARIESTFGAVDQRYLDAARKIEQVKRMHEKQRDVVHHAELAASLVEKVPRSNVLAEITNALPTGVSLLDLSLHSSLRQDAGAAAAAVAYAQQKPGDKPAEPPGPPRYDVKMSITGIAHDDLQVASLMSHLSHSPLFQNVNLVISEVHTESNKDGSKNEKGPQLRRWQVEMTLNPQAEVREDKTAAVELSK